MVVEFIVSFIIILAGVWFLAEVMQGAWYESVVPNLPARVFLASLIFTGVQVYSHIRIENMLGGGLPYLIASGILWVGGFWAFLQFATNHALGLGIAGMLILTSLSGMASDGFNGMGQSPRINTKSIPKKSVRMPRYNSPVTPFQLPSESNKTKATGDAAPKTVEK